MSAHDEMMDRGVTRPMAMSSMQQMHGKDMPMDEEHKMHMLKEHHHKTLWVYWLLIVLGFWLMASPWSFDYRTATAILPAERPIWLSLSSRINALIFSDVICGILLCILGFRALKPNRPRSLWVACGIGLWLNFAPVLFWAPKAIIYLNDTLVGTLIIALTILIPGMPNMIHYMKMGPEVPQGWSYNPSSWPQRWILIVLGLAGWLVSRYLACFQLGYLSTVWDPFFGDSTRKVLTSSMSRSWPISDAGLGAFSYTLEFLMGWMGSVSRWRTMPWMVAFFGFLVIPLGLVHIFLVISQPVVVGYWCTFCLVAAAIMLPMIPLEIDEVIAMIQFMKQALRRKEGNFWQIFWKGGQGDSKEKDTRTPPIAIFAEHPVAVARASIWGMNFPWTLIMTSLLGIWMMAAPAVLESGKFMADVLHVGGALVLTVSVISMGECVRSGRFLNCVIALFFISAPFIAQSPIPVMINGIVIGILVLVLSIPRGKIKESFGAWDRWVL